VWTLHAGHRRLLAQRSIAEWGVTANSTGTWSYRPRPSRDTNCLPSSDTQNFTLTVTPPRSRSRSRVETYRHDSVTGASASISSAPARAIRSITLRRTPQCQRGDLLVPPADSDPTVSNATAPLTRTSTHCHVRRHYQVTSPQPAVSVTSANSVTYGLPISRRPWRRGLWSWCGRSTQVCRRPGAAINPVNAWSRTINGLWCSLSIAWGHQLPPVATRRLHRDGQTPARLRLR